MEEENTGLKPSAPPNLKDFPDPSSKTTITTPRLTDPSNYKESIKKHTGCKQIAKQMTTAQGRNKYEDGLQRAGLPPGAQGRAAHSSRG